MYDGHHVRPPLGRGSRGRSFRVLNMLIAGTREGIAIEADYSLSDLRVVETLDQSAMKCGYLTAL